jgi:hypothetical protein
MTLPPPDDMDVRTDAVLQARAKYLQVHVELQTLMAEGRPLTTTETARACSLVDHERRALEEWLKAAATSP